MTRGFVVTETPARRAWPFLPFIASPEAFYQGPDGTTVQVRRDGGADPVVQGGRPRAGIAADPCPRRAP